MPTSVFVFYAEKTHVKFSFASQRNSFKMHLDSKRSFLNRNHISQYPCFHVGSGHCVSEHFMH